MSDVPKFNEPRAVYWIIDQFMDLCKKDISGVGTMWSCQSCHATFEDPEYDCGGFWSLDTGHHEGCLFVAAAKIRLALTSGALVVSARDGTEKAKGTGPPSPPDRKEADTMGNDTTRKSTCVRQHSLEIPENALSVAEIELHMEWERVWKTNLEWNLAAWCRYLLNAIQKMRRPMHTEWGIDDVAAIVRGWELLREWGMRTKRIPSGCSGPKDEFDALQAALIKEDTDHRVITESQQALKLFGAAIAYVKATTGPLKKSEPEADLYRRDVIDAAFAYGTMMTGRGVPIPKELETAKGAEPPSPPDPKVRSSTGEREGIMPSQSFATLARAMDPPAGYTESEDHPLTRFMVVMRDATYEEVIGSNVSVSTTSLVFSVETADGRESVITAGYNIEDVRSWYPIEVVGTNSEGD